MSDIDTLLDHLRNKIREIKVPGFLKDLRDELMEAVDDAALEVVEIGHVFSWKRFKYKMRRHGADRIREAWARVPWYLAWLRPFVMPPIMNQLRELLRRF